MMEIYEFNGSLYQLCAAAKDEAEAWIRRVIKKEDAEVTWTDLYGTHTGTFTQGPVVVTVTVCKREIK
jgi:hypothetical protein